MCSIYRDITRRPGPPRRRIRWSAGPGRADRWPGSPRYGCRRGLGIGKHAAIDGLVAGAQTQTAPPRLAVALPQVDLFPIFYGGRPTSVIEISFSESLPPGGLPASIFNTGTWQMTTAQALRERGIGVTVGEAAAYEKARAGHATHVYTNADIDRLHKSS